MKPPAVALCWVPPPVASSSSSSNFSSWHILKSEFLFSKSFSYWFSILCKWLLGCQMMIQPSLAVLPKCSKVTGAKELVCMMVGFLYIISTFLPLLQVFEHDKFHMLHQARMWHLIQSKIHAMVYFIFIEPNEYVQFCVMLNVVLVCFSKSSALR